MQGQSEPFYSLLTRKNSKCSHTLPSITEQETVSDKTNHFNLYFHVVFFLNLTLHSLETSVKIEQQFETIECFSKLIKGLKKMVKRQDQTALEQNICGLLFP